MVSQPESFQVHFGGDLYRGLATISQQVEMLKTYDLMTRHRGWGSSTMCSGSKGQL